MSDCELLQADLNALLLYYEKNRIAVNTKKCQCISFTRRKVPFTFPYNFNGSVIERVEVVRDLGVLLDKQLLIRDHIDAVSAKAYRNLGFVLRVGEVFTKTNTLKILYFAYVRSLLEFGSVIWSPQYLVYKYRLERIQKKFVRHLNYRDRSAAATYLQSCRQHKMLTAEERRTLLDMAFLYDIVRGNIDCTKLVEGISYSTLVR